MPTFKCSSSYILELLDNSIFLFLPFHRNTLTDTCLINPFIATILQLIPPITLPVEKTAEPHFASIEGHLRRHVSTMPILYFVDEKHCKECLFQGSTTV